MVDAGFPEEEYIIIENGIYSWNSRIPCVVDALEFEKMVLSAQEEQEQEKTEE